MTESNLSNVIEEQGLDFAPATLDPAHIGDIQGGLGTVSMHDHAPRKGWRRKLLTFAAIMGPGLIVMIGDNDAGAYQTYGQAGQQYGYTMLWVVFLLLPVLLINQEMVARLGTVTGVGHARLIKERFGKFWVAFSIFDLGILDTLTLLTEFIGVYFGLGYFGVPKAISVTLAGVLVFAIAGTGRFRVWERVMFVFILASFAVVPVALMAHPKWGPIGRGFVIPSVARGFTGPAILLIVALIGTTVAPWQLFFQQSNVLDKRLSPRWLKYERWDTFIGGLLTTIGACAVMIFGASLYYTKAFGPSSNMPTDSGSFNHAISVTLGHTAGALGAIVLLTFALVGAAAVPLSTAYAYSDTFNKHHSLHRGFRSARFFHGLRAAQILLACAVVTLGSDALLGTLTQYVQVLAGILLPSASLFLVLLCNDTEILGPWVNGRVINFFAMLIVGVLLVLSADLTIATLFPNLDGVKLSEACFGVVGGVAVVCAPFLLWIRRRRIAGGQSIDHRATVAHLDRTTWRMKPLDQLAPVRQTLLRQVSVLSLRAYLVVAMVVVGIKVFSPYIH
jgi:NRAMP (natural resistance-associated macrophage protein)-like metal ion transporter